VLHHIMGRGIEKRNIFQDDEDRTDFLDRLSALAREGAMDIYRFPNKDFGFVIGRGWPRVFQGVSR